MNNPFAVSVPPFFFFPILFFYLLAHTKPTREEEEQCNTNIRELGWLLNRSASGFALLCFRYFHPFIRKEGKERKGKERNRFLSHTKIAVSSEMGDLVLPAQCRHDSVSMLMLTSLSFTLLRVFVSLRDGSLIPLLHLLSQTHTYTAADVM